MSNSVPPTRSSAPITRTTPGPTRADGGDSEGPTALSNSADASAEVSSSDGMSRRRALKVLAAATALGTAPSCDPGANAEGPGANGHSEVSGFAPLPPNNPLAAGTRTDPDLVNPQVPWETVLTENEKRLVSALCDLIIPADEGSPSASAVGVPDYIDEHVSAPYPSQKEQLIVIRGGLTWLNQQASERFQVADFPSLTTDQQKSICDTIAYEPEAPDGLKAQARFFDLFRDLTSTGFWTTQEGMDDLGYVGNVPLPRFDGPPPEVLAALGLEGEDLV